MANVIIEPGQMSQLAFDIRNMFTESMELFSIVKPNILDWRNGAPRITFTSETHSVEYDDTRRDEPILNRVELREIGAQRTRYEHNIILPLTQQETISAEAKASIINDYKTDVVNDASKNGTITFLQDTVGKIDFAGEFANNRVLFNYKSTGADNNQRGLTYAQIFHAKVMLASRRLSSKDLVIIAPVSLQETLGNSVEFQKQISGMDGGVFDEQAMYRTKGIPTWWVPDELMIEAGLSSDNVDGTGAHGLYVYVLRGADTYFITSLGSEVLFNGEPFIKEDPDYKRHYGHALFTTYAMGATMKNHKNAIRISCRLD